MAVNVLIRPNSMFQPFDQLSRNLVRNLYHWMPADRRASKFTTATKINMADMLVREVGGYYHCFH